MLTVIFFPFSNFGIKSRVFLFHKHFLRSLFFLKIILKTKLNKKLNSWKESSVKIFFSSVKVFIQWCNTKACHFLLFLKKENSLISQEYFSKNDIHKLDIIYLKFFLTSFLRFLWIQRTIKLNVSIKTWMKVMKIIAIHITNISSPILQFAVYLRCRGEKQIQ